MRRLEPPKCTCCLTGNAGFESTIWPSVRLCYLCARAAITYMYRTGIINGNPLLIELASGVHATRDGVDGRRFIDAYVDSEYSASAMTNVYIYLEAESRIEVENPLDILDGLC